MKLWHSFLKELKLASRGYYFYIELVTSLILLLVLLFVIPENFSSKKKEYIYLDLQPAYAQTMIDDIKSEDSDHLPEIIDFKIDDEKISADYYETDESKIYIFSSKEALISATKKKKPDIGAIIGTDEENNFKYTYYLQGYESERIKKLYKLFHIKDISVLEEINDSQKVVTLDSAVDPLSDRENVVPLLLVFNGSLMGLFIIAAYIFLDKGEGIIKAYAVTPSSLRYYLWSKIAVVVTTTIASSAMVTIPVLGLQPNYISLLILLITSSIFFSIIGLIISTYYSDLMKSFGVMYVVMMILMVPMIAYFLPSWEPSWIKLIPTYPLIQGFKQSLLRGGNLSYTWIWSGIFLVLGFGLFEVVLRRFKKTLTI